MVVSCRFQHSSAMPPQTHADLLRRLDNVERERTGDGRAIFRSAVRGGREAPAGSHRRINDLPALKKPEPAVFIRSQTNHRIWGIVAGYGCKQGNGSTQGWIDLHGSPQAILEMRMAFSLLPLRHTRPPSHHPGESRQDRMPPGKHLRAILHVKSTQKHIGLTLKA